MEYIDENGNEITNPDLSKGKVTEQTRVTGTHTELMAGTEGRGEDGKGLFKTVTDTETVGAYHAYTDAEIAAMNQPTAEQRIAALESAMNAMVTA